MYKDGCTSNSISQPKSAASSSSLDVARADWMSPSLPGLRCVKRHAWKVPAKSNPALRTAMALVLLQCTCRNTRAAE